MIYGIGTDLLHIKTIEPSVRDESDPFVQKVYTKKELELIQSRPNSLYSYGTRFAGKEAVFKAFRVNGDAFRLSDIEILEDENGAPVVHLRGKAEALAKELVITNIHISLSYDTDYAQAFAIASTD
ncbi:MAG: holo-ACP synthase [Pseudobutyrivibrio sp.]|nr:holo-ACP synthase [Pseudobutyrivibrio sp.]